MKPTILFTLILLISSVIFGAVDVNNITIMPEFLKPGTPVTASFTMMKSGAEDWGNAGIRVAAVFSNDAIWSSDDQLFLYNGGSGIAPLATVDGTKAFKTLADKSDYTNGAWFIYNWPTITPPTFLHGETRYVIIRVADHGQTYGTETTIGEMDSNGSWTHELAIPFEVAVNKDIIYNTAYINGKTADAKYIISEGLPKVQLLADTSTTADAFNYGDTIYYTSKELSVNLTTETGGAINYSGGTLSGSFALNGKIYLASEKDTFELSATATKAGTEPQSAKWVFIRNLPNSRLYLNTQEQDDYITDAVTNKRRFTTPTLPIDIELHDLSGAIIPLSATTKIYYAQHNSAAVIGTNQFNKSTPFMITSSDTIRAIAIVDGFDAPVEGYWIYEQDLPPSSIVATPSVTIPSAYPFKSSSLNVDLTVLINGVTYTPSDSVEIWYTLGNTTPDTTNKTTTNKLIAGSKVTITSTDTLMAIAFLKFADNPTTGTWYYSQNFDKALLEADHGSAISTTPYQYNKGSLTVKLKTTTGGIIHYSIASQGGSVGSFTNILNDSGEVTIIGTDTIWAYADGETLGRVDTLWTYESTLPEADLSAEAKLVNIAGGDSIAISTLASDTIHFGHSTSVELKSSGVNGADNIKWTYGDGSGTTPDSWADYISAILINDGTPIPSPHSDTVLVTGYAFDDDHKGVTKTFVYIRDTVKTLTITSTSKFITSSTVTITLDSSWQNYKIFYTIDGTDPKQSSTPYTGALNISLTTTIKAIAFADNAVESKIISATTTKVTGTTAAWYKDSDGNGSIDEITIDLSQVSKTVPDSLVLLSPFDSLEIVIVPSSDITLSSDGIHLSAILATPFNFETEKSTYFATAQLGALSGANYWDYSSGADMFVISDSVAPVIIAARYIPTKVKKGHEADELLDNLVITFSEEIDTVFPLAPESKPFGFYDKSEGGEYINSLDIQEEITRVGATVTYSAVATNTYLPENEADSIRIKSVGNIIGADNIEQLNNTYWVPLSVDNYTYTWDIQVYPNPYSHKDSDKYALDIFGDITSNYEKVIGVFVTPIGKRALSGRIEANLVILDALGNVIHRAEGDGFISIETGTLTGSFVHIIEPNNELGRKLASGTYAASINLRLIGTDGNQSDKVRKKFLIGIKD